MLVRKELEHDRRGSGLVVATTQVLDGRYELTSTLGEGGMSVVWRGYDTALNRPVAVKVLNAELVADAAARERFQIEAQAAAQLSHPHITNVHDYGESQTDSDEPMPYIVMELLSGSTLADRLQVGPVPVQAVLQICAQVASALAAAHRLGIVHRDVKPGNVMLTPAGAKVLDFGLAAVAGQAERSTSDDEVLGTPAYVAPERLTADEVTPASDVYGLGLTLYRALAGRMPWRAESPPEMISAHQSAKPSPLPPITGLPPEVAELCHRCLAKDSVDRPTAAEVARVLAEAAGWRVAKDQGATPVPVLAAPAAPISGPRASMDVSRWRAAAMTGAAVAMVGVLAGMLTADQASDGARFLDPGAVAPAPATAGPTSPGTSGPAAEAEPEPGSGPADGPGTAERPVDLTAEDSSGEGGGLPDAAGSDSGSDSSGSGSDSGESGSDSGSQPPASGSGSGNGSESPPEDQQPDPVERTVDTVGGTVVARCVGNTVSLVSWQLLPGFSVGTVDPGPGSEARITLNALLTTVSVVVRCQGGVPVASIQVG